jgi:tetratricopeptide (TPR) repeat protein
LTVGGILRCFLALTILLPSFLWLIPAHAQQSEVDVLVAQAVIAYDEKRFPDAIAFLQQALKLDPNNLDALYYAGLTYLALNSPDRAAEVLEKARAKDPTDIQIKYHLGVAYFSLEQYDKAEPLLTEVFKERPQLENLGYYVGFMRYRKKDYQGALRALTAGTSSNPDIQQLTRFYAGLSMAILGLPEQAVAEVEEALRIQPSSALTGPAERLRDNIIAARQRDRRLQAELRIGAFYDTNVPVNPRKGSDPLVDILRARKSHSPGELATARLDYAWYRSGPWEAALTYSFLQTINNRIPFFNIQNHLGGLGATYKGAIASMPYQLGSQYTYDFLTLDNAAFLQRHTLTLFGTLVENAGNLTTLFARAQGKDFLNDSAVIIPLPQENRDAINGLAGLTHLFRFQGDKHFLRLGYQFDREWTTGRNYSYLGHRLVTGGQYTFPLPPLYDPTWAPPRLRYDYEVHWRDYRSINSILPTNAPGTVRRNDTEQLHIVRLEQPLPMNFTISAEYQATFARSNLDVFAFDRHVAYLILSWVY